MGKAQCPASLVLAALAERIPAAPAHCNYLLTATLLPTRKAVRTKNTCPATGLNSPAQGLLYANFINSFPFQSSEQKVQVRLTILSIFCLIVSSGEQRTSVLLYTPRLFVLKNQNTLSHQCLK